MSSEKHPPVGPLALGLTDEETTAFCAERGWVRTGVWATRNECEAIVGWLDQVAAAPVSERHRVTLCEKAVARFKRRIDRLAKARGLRARGEDHYGVLSTGEFVVSGGETKP
jgi:hypothetical protein